MNLVSGDVLVITPYGSQGKRIFKMMRQLLKRASDDIRSSIKRDVSAPFEMELANGSFIISRTSGERSGTQAASSRGEGAGLVVFDEMDRISNESVEAVTAIRTESANVEILGSSTPIGNRETKFYQFCNSPIHAEFYYPSMVMPTWSPQIEMTERLSRDRLSYIREILAEWGDPEAGVFPAEFVDLAQKDQVYRYGTDIGGIGRKPNWIYTMGVDWNHTTGTQIVVCGLDPEKKEVYVVDRAAIDALKWKQHVSVSKVEELNRVWRPKYIYVDWGFGNMQAEALHLRGTRAANQAAAMGIKRAPANLLADAALAEIVKAINSSEGTTIFDQATNEEVKRPTKQVMIQNAMRRFEQGSIHFPETDKPMASQLLSYVEKRVTSSGMPVYASSDSRIGDHIIDALFLALWAYTKEMSVFSGPQSSLFFSYSQPSALWRPSGARDIVEEEGEEIDEEDGCPNYKKASHSRWQMDEKPSPEIRQLMGGLMKSVVSANGSSPYHGARPSHQADNRSHRGLEGPQWHRKRRGNNRDLF
jgi:replicative DNA helicase